MRRQLCLILKFLVLSAPLVKYREAAMPFRMKSSHNKPSRPRAHAKHYHAYPSPSDKHSNSRGMMFSS
uniref:Uncharacterized protein n=1 Tax=mine drainage metagenome TaxID=410659 RepID=E6PUX5_9ZZZZ